MSYSVCINCEQIVPAYEKYCGQCLKLYLQLKQDKDFWRHNVYNVYTWETAKALAKEEIAGLSGSKEE